jgi:hypothetical protein
LVVPPSTIVVPSIGLRSTLIVKAFVVSLATNIDKLVKVASAALPGPATLANNVEPSYNLTALTNLSESESDMVTFNVLIVTSLFSALTSKIAIVLSADVAEALPIKKPAFGEDALRDQVKVPVEAVAGVKAALAKVSAVS